MLLHEIAWFDKKSKARLTAHIEPNLRHPELPQYLGVAIFHLGVRLLIVYSCVLLAVIMALFFPSCTYD